MARATRIALFEREVRERLSRAALELVLARAEVISEGQRSVRGERDAYFGSTMLTIDLPALELSRSARWPSSRRSSACIDPDTSNANIMSTPLASILLLEWVISGLASATISKAAAGSLRYVRSWPRRARLVRATARAVATLA
jgi:hypothetical protein